MKYLLIITLSLLHLELFACEKSLCLTGIETPLELAHDLNFNQENSYVLQANKSCHQEVNLGEVKESTIRNPLCENLNSARSTVNVPVEMDIEELPLPSYVYEADPIEKKLKGAFQNYLNSNDVSHSLKKNFKTGALSTCENMPITKIKECYNFFIAHFNLIRDCYGNQRLPEKENRHIISSYRRDPKFKNNFLLALILSPKNEETLSCLAANSLDAQIACTEDYLSSGEQQKLSIRLNLFNRFNVVVLSEGNKIRGNDEIRALDLQDLTQIQAAYEDVYNSMSNILDDPNDFSHVWGSGGFLAREGDPTLGGQFGEVERNSPMIVDMVADPSSNPSLWSPEQIAERIVHENFHSQDFLDGSSTDHSGHNHDIVNSWTDIQNNYSQGIYAACAGMINSNPSAEQREFQACYDQQRNLFNYRTDKPNYPYSAYSGYEYYASMGNQWLRDARNGTQTEFACRDNQSRQLWGQMEEQLLGKRTTQCPDLN